MIKKLSIFIVVLTFLATNPVYSQWNGGLNVDGTWNFKENNSENVDFKLKHVGNKFSFNSNLYFGHSYLLSSQATTILDAKKEKNEYYKGEDKNMNSRKLNTGANFGVGYVFNPNNVLDASLSYDFSESVDNSLLYTERINSFDGEYLYGIQNDSAYMFTHKISGNIAYVHKFENRPQASIDVIASELIGINTENNRRITNGNFYSNPKNYKTFKNLNDYDSKVSVSYNDIFDFGARKLKLKTGLDFVGTTDFDNYSASTLVNGQWRDSTEYRQSYLYNSYAIEPYVNLTYSVGKFDFFIKERVQFYWHSLMNRLVEKEILKEQDNLFDKFDIQNLLSAGVVYNINSLNGLSFDYSRSLVRPDYKKLCPVLMIGNSDGEYFIGNPELLPESIYVINFGHTFKRDKFVTSLDINYQDKSNTAEKIIDIEKSKDIHDPGVKTIYTWVNTKHQSSLGTKLDLKVNGKDVKAEVWAGFYYDIYRREELVTKEDFNYEVGTSVDVSLSERIKLSSSLIYISAKESAYNLKGEDVLANLRITTALSKKINMYLEFRDIVDKDIYEITWNEQMTYYKESSTKPQHRALLIGINYQF